MTWFPKLPAQTRAEFLATVRRKREIAKRIAELKDEKRSLPTIGDLCRQHRVSWYVARRLLYGEPYKASHPQEKGEKIEPSDAEAHAA